MPFLGLHPTEMSINSHQRHVQEHRTVACTYVSAGEAEAGRLHIRGQPKLQHEFKANLGYIVRTCLKKGRKQ
jgi:hypothetical protein